MKHPYVRSFTIKNQPLVVCSSLFVSLRRNVSIAPGKTPLSVPRRNGDYRTMLHIRTFILSVILAIAAVTGVAAGGISIEKPWAKAMLPGAPAGAGFLTIHNNSGEADRLLAASSPASGRVEIHSMVMDNGVMKMRPVEGGLELPKGETVELKPGGYHLMMMMVDKPFAEGESVKVTLKFEKAGAIDVDLMVMAAGAHEHMK